MIGTYADVQAILEKNGIDQVLIALPLDSIGYLEEILKRIGPSMVDIKVIPDIYRFISLRGGIEDFDGMPVVSLLDTPLGGWNDVLKRAVDVIAGAGLLVLLSPLLLLIARGDQADLPGPGLLPPGAHGPRRPDVPMLKFRTMRVDAERETGAVWARQERPAPHAVRRLPPAALASTSCRSSSTCCGAT